MQPRIDIIANDLGARIAKRIFNVGLAIEQSTLPKAPRNSYRCGPARSTAAAGASTSTTRMLPRPATRALRLSLVAAWRHSTVFSEAERAALTLTEEGTRMGDANPGVSDETWAQVRKHYDDDQIVALVSAVALINATNRLSVILDYPGGSYEPGMMSQLQN